MPYSKDELQDLPFYQEITAQDESRYLEMIGNKTQDGNVDDGILRDKNSGKIILFENIIPNQGTDGTSFPVNNKILYQDGYFKYEETEETNKIIKREFTEF
jgi:hypothetical protein|tara:strand:- start:641 stop:943 length:303 start_codon:yes stop_codon:yes gene_type:complete